jgi:DNA modification methylase
MKDCRAQMVFTNPEYNNPIEGYVTGPGKIHHPEFISASGEMSPSEFTSFLMTVFAQMVRNALDGTLHFICMDWRHSGELISAARSVYSEFMSLCVWVKDRAEQGSLYRSQHELVFVFKSGEESHRNNIQVGKHRRCRTNVWRYPRVNSLSRSSDEASSSILGPTTKPVELVADAILDCSARGSVVLDPFLGSGTTLIAAQRSGRCCYAMELEPAYVDTAVRRWQRYTGLTAIHEATGESFAQREKAIADGWQ